MNKSLFKTIHELTRTVVVTRSLLVHMCILVFYVLLLDCFPFYNPACASGGHTVGNLRLCSAGG